MPLLGPLALKLSSFLAQFMSSLSLPHPEDTSFAITQNLWWLLWLSALGSGSQLWLSALGSWLWLLALALGSCSRLLALGSGSRLLALSSGSRLWLSTLAFGSWLFAQLWAPSREAFEGRLALPREKPLFFTWLSGLWGIIWLSSFHPFLSVSLFLCSSAASFAPCGSTSHPLALWLCGFASGHLALWIYIFVPGPLALCVL